MIPRRLPERAAIGVCAPAGRVDAAPLERGVAYLRSLGHEVVVAPHISDDWRYFSAPDEERVADLMGLVADDRLDMVMPARGGYGLSRILDRIDWARVAASAKLFVGFSDFTGFNCAAYAKGGLVTFQGPMVASDFGSGEPLEFMASNLWPALRDAHAIEGIASQHPYGARRIEGTLWGGNLALLAHLVGTPFFPAIDGGILFVEEIGEDPYAIERMFLQLLHAGVLEKQRALILADFTDCKPNNPNRYPYSMGEVIESLRSWLPYPVLTGLPFGHVARKVTLPFGAAATLAIETSAYTLRFAGHVR